MLIKFLPEMGPANEAQIQETNCAELGEWFNLPLLPRTGCGEWSGDTDWEFGE